MLSLHGEGKPRLGFPWFRCLRRGASSKAETLRHACTCPLTRVTLKPCAVATSNPQPQEQPSLLGSLAPIAGSLLPLVPHVQS